MQILRQFRLAAFVISAVYGAIGGTILGFRIGLADPELVHWTHSGHLVFMTVLGGFSSFLGPDHRCAGSHAAAGPAAVDHAVLALRAGRHPGRHGVFFPRGLAGIASDAAQACSAGAAAAEVPHDPLVETKGVSKHYGEFRALDDVSCRRHEGEFVSIVGPNGAGKTTLVNLLTGLLVPTRGQVFFKGANIAGVGPIQLAKRGMARTFQLVQIFPAAHRRRDHCRRRRVPAAEAVAAVLARSRRRCAGAPRVSTRSPGLRFADRLENASRRSRRARRSSWTWPPPSHWRPR